MYIVDIVQAGGGEGRGDLEGVLGGPKKRNGIVKRERRPRKRKTSVCALGIRTEKTVHRMTSFEG